VLKALKAGDDWVYALRLRAKASILALPAFTYVVRTWKEVHCFGLIISRMECH